MKVKNTRIEIDSSVLPGIDVLSAEEKDKLWQAIESLEPFDPERAIVYNVRKFKEDERLYLLKIDDSLRVIFKLTENGITVVELFRQEMIEYMFKK